jgi:hypothetical protein
VGRACRRAGTFSAAQEKCWDGPRWPACWAIRAARRCLPAAGGPSGAAIGEQVEAAAFCAQGQARHLSVHVRRAPQVDLWDYKPNLAALYDKDIPDSVRGAQQLTGMTAGQARFPIAPSHWAFKRYGETGTWVSDLLPYTRRAWSTT